MRDKKSIQDIVFNNPRADRKSPLLGDDDVGDRMLYDGRKDTLKRIRDVVKQESVARRRLKNLLPTILTGRVAVMKSHTQQVKVEMERALLDRLLRKVKSKNLSEYLGRKLQEDLLSTSDAHSTAGCATASATVEKKCS